jgi:predicted Zn finger-like uncharacterized protein
MDVICNRCGTEYDFEDALVSPRGTTVKCTQCGHLFKIQRVEDATVASLSSHWTVRTNDGGTRTLPDLSELPRMVREGSVGRDDELSRTGQIWRRLGDIEELDEHFIAADRRGPSRAGEQAGTTSQGLGLGSETASEPSTPSARKPRNPPNRPPKIATGSRSVDDQRSPKASSPPLPAPSLGFNPDDEPTAVAPRGALSSGSQPEAQRYQHHLTPTWETTGAEERTAGIQHESRRRAWARLLASAALVASGTFWFFSSAPSAPSATPAHRVAPAPAEDPAPRWLAAAEAAVASHRLQGFEIALENYGHALSAHDHDDDTRVLCGISRVHALWANALLSDSELSKRDTLQAGTTQPPTPTEAVREHVQQAQKYAALALQSRPGDPEALLVHSDALRLAGALPEARAALDTAFSQDKPSAEGLRIAALLLHAETGDARAAADLAAQAVDAAPDLLRLRLSLAELRLKQGDREAARTQLQALAAMDPQHPRVAELEALLKPTADSNAAAAQTTPGASTATATSEHEASLERGNALLQAGQTAPAKRAFEQALSLQPGSAAAHFGLGQTLMARGRPIQALDQYVAAAVAGHNEALFAVAELYRKLGRQREALTAYQSYLQRSPSGAQLDAAKVQLARLEEQLASARKP